MYKKCKPRKVEYLQVDKDNKIFIKHYGNPDGIPVIYLHGGPGGNSTDKITKDFNLKYFNLIYFDQRGCGKSKPKYVIKNNNTKNLINDIEKIRLHLKIKKFIIYGGSWGATLSILYCIKYPQNILSYVVSSGTYFTSNTVWPKSVFDMYPDKWYDFCKIINIPDSDINNPTFEIQKNICKKYFNKIKNNETKYINSWYNFENDLVYTTKKNNKKKDNKKVISFYESYYYSKNFFIPNHFIEKNCYKIKDINGYILHGRLDIICDFRESYIIHKHLPKSNLIIIDNEGHWGDISDKEIVKTFRLISKKYYKNSKKYYNKE